MAIVLHRHACQWQCLAWGHGCVLGGGGGASAIAKGTNPHHTPSQHTTPHHTRVCVCVCVCMCVCVCVCVCVRVLGEEGLSCKFLSLQTPCVIRPLCHHPLDPPPPLAARHGTARHRLFHPPPPSRTPPPDPTKNWPLKSIKMKCCTHLVPWTKCNISLLFTPCLGPKVVPKVVSACMLLFHVVLWMIAMVSWLFPSADLFWLSG